jgi:hypothetical protein
MSVPASPSEEWRPIPGWPKYEASTLGRVRGPQCIHKGSPDHGGYLRTAFCVGDQVLKRSVHSMVALAFHGPRPGNFHVDHINGVKTDNRPENLRYVSQAKNEANKARLGAAIRGAMNAIVTVPAYPVSDLERMARAFAASKLFGVQNPEQALALCLVAQAEGRHPATAAQDYSIIQGRPSKKADAMLRDFLAGGGKVEVARARRRQGRRHVQPSGRRRGPHRLDH